MSIPNDLVPIADIASKFKGKTVAYFLQESRAKRFPDVFHLGRTPYVSAAAVDQWAHGHWQSVRTEVTRLVVGEAKVNRFWLARQNKAAN